MIYIYMVELIYHIIYRYTYDIYIVWLTIWLTISRIYGSYNHSYNHIYVYTCLIIYSVYSVSRWVGFFFSQFPRALEHIYIYG